MDALRKLGSMRSRRRVSAAASAQAPEKLAEIVGTAATLNNKEDVGDQVSNGVSDFVQDEASNGEVFLHGEEEEEEETEGEEDSTAKLTPIRAPVSVDDDGGGGGGDGDVSSGSGESFDSALERMAASSTPSYEASPVGSYNAPSSSHILHNIMMMQQQEQEQEQQQQQQQQQKGLGVGQQGALMRLNHMISGQSTLDTAVIENCTEEEFKHKMEEIARSKDLSLDDARISSIMDALLPLLLVHDQGGGSQTASESKPEYDERNVVPEEEDDKNKKEDVDDASAPAAMPVAKLSAEDEEEEEELLIQGDQAFEEKGERPNGDEFVEANEGADEGEEDEETLFDNRKGNIIKGNLSSIIAHESRDDDKTKEVATAQAATSEEKQSNFPSDAVLPKELGSVLIAHEEPILQKGATRETKEEDGDIEDKTEVLLVPQEESEECKETESNAEALAEKESATGGPSEEETLPLVVSETRFAQPKGEEDVAAAPKDSSHIEAVEVGKEAPKPSPVIEGKSESEIGEDNSTITVPINTEQAITMKEEEEEGVPEEVASEEADGLRAVENRAASESAIISKPPRGEVNTEEEESLLSAVPKQVSSRDVIKDSESVETNSIVDSVTDKDGFDNQTTPELPIATEDFTTEEDRANKVTTAVLLAAENDKTLDASDVDLSLPDTVKSVNPVTENGGAETAAVVEAEPKSAFLSELQDSNGDWDGEEEDKEEVNDEEEDGDEEEEEEEHDNLDAAEALAALVKSARSESESRSENSKTPSLGAAGPSLPQRPTGRSRPTTALEPPRNPPHSNLATASQLAAPPEDNPSNGDGNDGNDETREKLQNIRVKFLRLAHRLGQSPQNVVVAQVLYRLGLAEQLRGGRSASRAGAFSFDRANAIAEEQEAVSGQEEELDFACTVLLLGKTGVGKSATINSIFDEPRTSTNAFHPSTKKVQEIVGHVHGIKVRVIDTPGLLPSVMDQQHNERIMGSVKNYIRKSSPDIVLYFDRLDMQSRDYGDLPLLRTITDLFGAAIWFNAIVVLTHASSAPPDGPNGVPLSYEMFVAQRSHVVQQTIRQAAGDMRLMNPVSLVENHPACRTNRAGQRVLPNGQIWKPQLLLLCFASKILADANSLLKLQDTSSPGRPFGQRPRVPPLPFLLSSLLQSRAQLKVADEQMGDEDDADSDDESDVSDGDDYDELPPFRPLAKEELEELNKEQKQQYAEEVADRERLFQKKQWREELKRRKEMRQRAAAMSKEELAHAEEGVDDDGGRAAAVPVPMPDMALPPSFDSDNPTHRYRYLETANQWLVRPVLETHGWDHDAGYDGFNVEKLFVVADKIPASISGQVTKDKKESQVNFEAAASFKHGECKSTLAGFDIQTIGKDLGYTLRSETQFNNFKRNKTTAGLTFTLLGDTITAGLKLEDRLLIGKRFKVVVNGGVLTGRGDKAFGGSLEATLRGKQYPLSRTLSTLGLSVMDWHGDLAIGGNLQSQFMVGKTMMVARANLNNRGAGQVSIRASSSEQLQMVLIGIVPIFRSLINSRFGTAQPSQ